MDKSKDKDENTALFVQVLVAVATYLLSWWKSGPEDKNN